MAEKRDRLCQRAKSLAETNECLEEEAREMKARSPKEMANSSHQRLNHVTLSAEISAGRLITMSCLLKALFTGVRSKEDGFGQLIGILFFAL